MEKQLNIFGLLSALLLLVIGVAMMPGPAAEAYSASKAAQRAQFLTSHDFPSQTTHDDDSCEFLVEDNDDQNQPHDTNDRSPAVTFGTSGALSIASTHVCDFTVDPQPSYPPVSRFSDRAPPRYPLA